MKIELLVEKTFSDGWYKATCRTKHDRLIFIDTTSNKAYVLGNKCFGIQQCPIESLKNLYKDFGSAKKISIEVN